MDTLSATFAALADPTRRAILTRLAKGEATVNELAAPFAMSLPSVSRHLKVLERAGLVIKGRSAQWRPCRLEVAPLQSADAWLASYREFFERRFDHLEAYVKEMAANQEDRPTPLMNLSDASEATAEKMAAHRRVGKARPPQPKEK